MKLTTFIQEKLDEYKDIDFQYSEKQSPTEIVIKPEVLDLDNVEEGDGNTSYRPTSFDEFIGQKKAKERIECYIKGCRKFDDIFPNTFLSANAGCFKYGTKILMYDYTLKNIEDIKIGDIVLGYDEKPKNNVSKRKFLPTIVTKLHKRQSDGLVYLKSNKNEVWTTNEHPFLIYSKTRKRNRFIKANRVMSQHYLLNFPIEHVDTDFKIGWLIGFVMADGSIVGQHLHFYNKNKLILKRLKKYLKDVYSLNPCELIKENGTHQISLQSKLITRIFNNNIKNLKNLSKNMKRGIISGFFDGDGTVINNKGNYQHPILCNTNKIYINKLTFILNELGFKTKIYTKKIKKRNIKTTIYKTKKSKIYHLHIYDLQKFYCTFIPISKIYYSKINGKQEFQRIVVKKIFRRQDFSKKMDFTVYNLTTDCGTYIANGFPVHNCGKTLFANILANKLGKKFITCTAGELKSEQQLVDKIVECKSGILFLDEAHRIGNKLGTFMLPILEEFKISGKKIKPFTTIFASTHKGNLSENLSALLQRFPLTIELENYTNKELITIFNQFLKKQYPSEKVQAEILNDIALNCRNTPRIGLGLLKEYIYIKDWQQVKHNNNIIKEGLTLNDLKILRYIKSVNGAGKTTLAKFLRVEPKTYEHSIEPFLMQKELITVSNKRKLTEKGKEFLNEIQL